MTDTDIELSEDAFAALFPLRTNHFNPGASGEHPDGGGCLFETYGKELAYVEQQDCRTIWTVTEDDDGNGQLESGYHAVNRIGYLLSTVPTPDGVNIHVRLDSGDHDLIPSRRRRAMKAELVIADYGTGDATENLTDLLTDFRHWCDEHGEDFARLDQVACRHYIVEHNDKED
jgi:hypothetical protein